MGRRSRSRFVAENMAVVTFVAVAIVLLGLLGPGSGGSGGGAPADATVLTIERSGPEPAIPAGFLGLSLEFPAIVAYAGDDPLAVDPVLVQLIRNLTPGQSPVLRIGGDTTDWTWWPVFGLGRPPGVTFALSDRWMQVTKALADTLRARLILGINLEANSLELTATEARALIDGVGRGQVDALELGNEPALYGVFAWYRKPDGHIVRGRPRGYDFTAFAKEFTTFSSVLPHVPVAGPALGESGWIRHLGQFLAAEPQVALVTVHRYPLQLCFSPRSSSRYPTIAHLLSAAASTGLADAIASSAKLAHARGLRLRLDEINTLSCGADATISNTFASALWALDALFELARVGVDGVNVHTFPGAGYELFRFASASGHWRASVAPEYYGLLMFAQAAPAGSRLLRVSAPGGSSVKSWATRSPDGTIRIVLINKGIRPRAVLVRAPGNAAKATLERLTAPSLEASTGVTLGGKSFGLDTDTGVLAGRSRISAVTPVAGRYDVRLPAGSAALLVIR